MKISQKYILFLLIIAMLSPVIISYLIAPNLKKYQNQNPPQTKFMQYYLKKSGQVSRQAFIGYSFVSLPEISPYLSQAVIFAEDCNFYRHYGIDWQSIFYSFQENQRRGKIIHGGSTLTMQLCKNMFLYPKKTFFRKIIEMLLALRLEKNLTKERILELYLNVIEWGPAIYGAENASQYYFNKSARELTLEESAFLASIIMNPQGYKLGEKNNFFENRQQWIISNLENKDNNIWQDFLSIFPKPWLVEIPFIYNPQPVTTNNNEIIVTINNVSKNIL